MRNSICKWILLTCCLLASRAGYSQCLEYGMKLGIPISHILIVHATYNHINVDKPEIWKHYFVARPGFNISLRGGYQLNPKVFLGIEPGYILKGIGFDDYNARLFLHYWNLPLLFKYTPSKSLGLCLGPEFALCSGAQLTFEGRDIDMNDFYEPFETSFFIGVEFKASDNVGLGFRYNIGLTKISETQWSDESGNVLGIDKESNHYFLFYMTLTNR